ncbi:cardiolipin synthase [Caldalkalibacillus mannanilyticus]|uniref:cardiolipin synthase n=1 Tax=Caldalkalibacillus mannanilyticus TaxID=1418 RepID=UPI000687DE51|nr:cardiolipin synthase [Caldalkalibacillus mannanilyticus]
MFDFQLSTLLGFVSIINILLAIIVIFLERRNVSATWAWLLILYFTPILGFILYIIFGQNLSRRRIFKWDKQVQPYIKQAVRTQMEQLETNPAQFQSSIIEEYRDLIYMNLNHDEAPLTQNNEVQILTDGQQKFDLLLKDIESAKEHIHMLYYIIRSDELGEKIAQALMKKAKEGVEVRLLYDDRGSRKLTRSFIHKLRQSGALLEPFFPAKIPFLNLRINYRNHRKLVIIDGRIGYIGGFNIGNEYLGLHPKFGYWRDTHLKIIGDSVNNIQSRFMLDWNQASKQKVAFMDYYYFSKKTYGDTGVQIVSTGPDTEWEKIKNGLIKTILSAKKYVYLQTPYFIPDDSFLEALRIASLSGVDVRVMIPNKPDHPFVYWATYSYAGELLKAGAKIYIYQHGFLHAKTIVADGKVASVGTTNIDVRSFRLNFEVNAFLYHSDTAEQLTAIFEEDVLHSTELTPALYMQRSFYIRLKESVSRSSLRFCRKQKPARLF